MLSVGFEYVQADHVALYALLDEHKSTGDAAADQAGEVALVPV